MSNYPKPSFMQKLTRLLLILLVASTSGLNFGIPRAQTISGQSSDTTDEINMTLPDYDSVPLYIAIDPSSLKPEFDQYGHSVPIVSDTNLRQHGQPYKSETVETILNPRNEVEFMIIMDEGDVLLFAWEAEEELYYDLHGHQREGNPDIWTRYSDGKKQKDHGSIVAPYSGDHGWYWVNLGVKPIKIRLTIAGYYEDIFKVNLSGQAE